MTVLPIKSVKMLPNMDAIIGGGVRSGMHAGPDCKLSLLVEARLLRCETSARVWLIPLEHCGYLEPAPVEQPQAAKK